MGAHAAFASHIELPRLEGGDLRCQTLVQAQPRLCQSCGSEIGDAGLGALVNGRSALEHLGLKCGSILYYSHKHELATFDQIDWRAGA